MIIMIVIMVPVVISMMVPMIVVIPVGRDDASGRRKQEGGTDQVEDKFHNGICFGRFGFLRRCFFSLNLASRQKR